MQQKPENDLIYLLASLEAAEKIMLYSGKFENAVLFFESENQLHFNASLLLLATIGEHVSKVSPDTRNKYQNISWAAIKAFRNRIVHDYSGVDFELTFIIISTEIPKLISDFQTIIQSEVNSGIFLLEEVEVARNSAWYRHVNFDSFYL